MKTFSVLSAIFLLAGATPTGLQGQDADRWLPWVGCWESVDGAPAAPVQEGDGLPADATFLLCVTPLEGGMGVQLVSYEGGEAKAREVLRSDGVATALEDEGCSGEQRGQWSSDGRRFFLTSQMVCGEGLLHEGRSVFSFLPNGREWLEVQTIQAQDGDPLVGIRRFQPAGPSVAARFGITDPSAGRSLAVATARAEAASALSGEDVLEVVRVAGSHAAGALVAEREQSFALDASRIRALTAQGLPGEVLDVMVATTYPTRFALQGGSRDVGADRYPPYGSRRIYGGTGFWGPRYGGFYGYDPFFYGSGYGGYYGYGRYGWWGYPAYGTGSRVVVVQPPTVQDRSRVDRNRGYVSGSGGSSGSSGSARGVAPTRGTPQPVRPAVTPRGTTVTPPPPARSGGGEVRRARPRNTGGNNDGGN